MGSLTPPWADELLAQNTKIARKMMTSLSTESYFDEDTQLNTKVVEISTSPSPPRQQQQRPNRFLVSLAGHPNNITNDGGRHSPSGSATMTPNNAGVGSVNGEMSGGKVVEPPTGKMASSQSTSSASSSASTVAAANNNNNNSAPSSAGSPRMVHRQYTRNTEKLSPIRNEQKSMFVDDEVDVKKSLEMTNGGEDLSILEYGPGIVKKLRSRYQSLALRQYAARPTLRRSASLENCLDAVSAEDLAATLESKISEGSSAITSNGVVHARDILEPAGTVVVVEEEVGGGGRRGREPRRNRFQHSASTDSRTSSPGATVLTMMTTNSVPPPQLQSPEENGTKGSIGSGVVVRGRASGPDATARRDRMRRARSVDALHRSKREEEILEKFKHVVLPKEEIVIIEVSKPPQNMSSATSAFNQVDQNGHAGIDSSNRFPTTRLLLTTNNLRNSGAAVAAASILEHNKVRNLMISPEHELPPHDIVRETARIFERNQENLNRRVGQALRLSKVASAAAESSPPMTPTSPTPSTTSPSSQQQKMVTAQSTTAMQDKSFSTTSSTKTKPAEANNATASNNNSAAMANGPSHGQRQIGIIKPTLSSISGNSNGLINNVNSKIANNGGGSESNRVRSPILSPIGFNHSNKPFLQHSSKPPLSPKPIFTSSPKVTFPTEGSKGKSAPRVESPSTSPILIVESSGINVKERSLSPFKSDSPVAQRVPSPVKSNGSSPTGSEDRHDIFLNRSISPVVNGKVSPGKVSPVSNGGGDAVPTPPKRVAFRSNTPPEEKEIVRPNKTVTIHSSEREQGSVDHRQQVPSKQQSVPLPPPRSVSPNPTPPAEAHNPHNNNNNNNNSNNNKSGKPVSQLRVHQKKSNQGGNGSMVFNFTSRKDVPDYIEDDGLRRDVRSTAVEDDLASLDKDNVDSKLPIPVFEGGNVIINGKSSIQKRPKSQKMSISFNETATTTHEYPSEASFSVAEESTDNDNQSKKPNVISGSSLGSYTPKVGSNTYQLGSYNNSFDSSSPGHKKSSSNGGGCKEDDDLIEDYLKPNTESTTWSNEMSADILF